MKGKKLLIVLVIGLSLFCTTSNAGLWDFTQIHITRDIISWQPKWEVGDWWTVITFKKPRELNNQEWQKPLLIQYKIISEETIKLVPYEIIRKESYDKKILNGKIKLDKKCNCYVVEAKCIIKKGNEDHEKIDKFYFNTENLILHRFVLGESLMLNFNYFSKEPIISRIYNVIMCDMPYFPITINSNDKFNKYFLVYNSGGEVIKERKKYQITSFEKHWLSYIKKRFPKIKNKDNEEIFEDTKKQVIHENKIYTNLNNNCFKILFGIKNKNDEKHEVIQIWSPGIPWWIYCESEYERSYLIDHSWSYKKDN